MNKFNDLNIIYGNHIAIRKYIDGVYINYTINYKDK